jgi:4-hydroxybenzoate polyprenyltransferase
MTSNAARTGPFFGGFYLWVKERYPPTVWILSLLFYVSSALFVREVEGTPAFAVSDVFYFLAVWSLFLVLRVLDEHKDYQEDCVNHPDRVLQSGKITLADLRRVGHGCMVWQILIVAIHPNLSQVAWAWVITYAWVGLMTKEFFCSRWLKRNLLVYGVSHMVVTPLIVWWTMTLASRQVISYSPEWLLLPALSFFCGLLFEIARKTKGVDEEREGVDSYSKSLGNLVCLRILIGSAALAGAIGIALLTSRPYFAVTALVVIAATFLACRQYLKFYRNPTSKMRKHNEAMSALFMIVVYVAYSVSFV